jgi:hypothetical protein
MRKTTMDRGKSVCFVPTADIHLSWRGIALKPLAAHPSAGGAIGNGTESLASMEKVMRCSA